MKTNNISISKHYEKRYRERIARTKRVQKFANDAFNYGKSSSDITGKLKEYILERESDGYIVRYYQKYLHIFNALTNTAVTVYKVPNHA